MPTGSVIVHKVDVVELGIREVDAIRGQVQGYGVRPVNLRADDDSAVGPIHVGSFDMRVLETRSYGACS